ENIKPPEVKKEIKSPVSKQPAIEKRKITFKEKHEFEKLGEEIETLENEKKEVTGKLNNRETDYKKLQDYTTRISEISRLLDEKEMRWLELSQWIEGN